MGKEKKLISSQQIKPVVALKEAGYVHVGNRYDNSIHFTGLPAQASQSITSDSTIQILELATYQSLSDESGEYFQVSINYSKVSNEIAKQLQELLQGTNGLKSGSFFREPEKTRTRKEYIQRLDFENEVAAKHLCEIANQFIKMQQATEQQNVNKGKEQSSKKKASPLPSHNNRKVGEYTDIQAQSVRFKKAEEVNITVKYGKLELTNFEKFEKEIKNSIQILGTPILLLPELYIERYIQSPLHVEDINNQINCLDLLAQVIKLNQKGIIKQAIVGEAGVGKTWLASRYVNEAKYNLIVWVNEATLLDTSYELAQWMGYKPKNTESNIWVKEVYRQLLAISGIKILLVMDDMQESYLDFLPSEANLDILLHVVFTSCQRNWLDVELITLKVFNNEEAINCLQKLLPLQDTEKGKEFYRNLAQRVQYSPIALSIVANYIRSIGVNEYVLNQFIGQFDKYYEKHLIANKVDKNNVHISVVASLLNMVVKKLKQDKKYNAIGALCYLSHLQKNYNDKNTLFSLIETKITFTDYLSPLIEYGLLKEIESTKNKKKNITSQIFIPAIIKKTAFLWQKGEGFKKLVHYAKELYQQQLNEGLALIISHASSFITHFYELGELKISAEKTNNLSNWLLVIEKFNDILGFCEICTHYEDDLLTVLISSLQAFKNSSLCQRDISLQEEVRNSFNKLLLLLANKLTKEEQKDYIPQVITLLEEFVTMIGKEQYNKINLLPFYLLAHEYISYVKDTLLEIRIVSGIATQYMQQGNARLGMYYSTYGYYLEFGQTNSEAKTLLPLIKQEYYFLYHLLVDPPFIFRQIAINQNEDKTACFNLYDRLCDLADTFFAWEDYQKADQCYEILRVLLTTYPATNARHANRCIEGKGRVKLRQKPVNDDNVQRVIEQYKEKRNCLQKYREESHKLLPNTEKVQGELSNSLIDFVSKLCNEVTQQLGPAPCQRYSLLRLGSLARNEACFYSDLEFAIVWADKKECANQEDIDRYFKAFVTLLELKIISLGETNELCGIPKQQGIATITQRMNQGLRFDEAGHYPFSDKCKLIGKIAEFSKLIDINKIFNHKYLSSLTDYEKQLPFIAGDDTALFALLDADLLYGENELAHQFKRACYEVLNQSDDRSGLFYRQVIGYSLITYNFLKESKLSLKKENINIKTRMLHLPQRIVASWALFYGIEEKNSQRRIEQLVFSNTIPQSLASILSYAIEFAFLLRLQAQWFYQQEQDDLYLEQKEGRFSLSTIHDIYFQHYLIKQVYPLLLRILEEWKDKANQAPNDTKKCFHVYEKEVGKILPIFAEHCIYCNDYTKGFKLYQLALKQPNVKDIIFAEYKQNYQKIREKMGGEINNEYVFFVRVYQPLVRIGCYLLLYHNVIPVDENTTVLLDNLIAKIHQLDVVDGITKAFVIASLLWIDALVFCQKKFIIKEKQNIIRLVVQFIIKPVFKKDYSTNLIIGNLIHQLNNSSDKKKVIDAFFELMHELKIEIKHHHVGFQSIYQQLLQNNENSFNNRENAYLFYMKCKYNLWGDKSGESILQDMSEYSAKDGFRLSERLAYEKLQWYLSNLDSKDNYFIDTVVAQEKLELPFSINMICSNGDKIVLHPDVVKKIIDMKTGHLRHLAEEHKGSQSYIYRNVSKIEHSKCYNIALHFKEHPDFPIMAYASDILNRRLCGHGSPPNDLVVFEVIWNTNQNKLAKSIWYPVLVSLTVQGPSLKNLLDEKFYSEQVKKEQLLSEFFIIELIKHRGNGFARNFIMTSDKGELSPYPVSINNEQMFVRTYSQEGLIFSETKINEINIIYCLDDFQQGGTLSKSLNREALRTFSTLDVYRLLNAWLDTVKEKEKLYGHLIDTAKLQELIALRGNNYPFMLNTFFPEGVIAKLTMELQLIKDFACKAIKNNTQLSPQFLLEQCCGQKLANLYFMPHKLTPSERLRLVTNRVASASSTEYQKYYLGAKKTFTELSSSHYFIESARKEIHQYYHQPALTNSTFIFQDIKIPKGMKTILDYQSIPKQQQIEQINHLSSQRSFQQLYIENCEILTDDLLKLLLKNSKDTLEVLSFYGHQQVTVKTLIYLADNFRKLKTLIASEIGVTHIRTNFLQPLLFPQLEVLKLNYCQNLRSVYLKAPKMTQLELKEHTQLITVEVELPALEYGSFENNLKLIDLKVVSKPSTHLYLDDVNKKCNAKLPSGWEKQHELCCFNPIAFLRHQQGALFANVEDRNMLMQAAFEGKVGMVKWLLKNKEHDYLIKSFIKERDKLRWTALHYAAKNGSLENVKLITKKIKEFGLYVDGTSIMPLAIEQDNVPVVAYLKKQITMESGKESKEHIQRQLLMEAASKGKIEVLQWLLNKRPIIKEILVLHNAAANDHLEAVKIIIEKMKAISLSIDKEDNNGNTALSLAAREGHKNVVIYLKEQGANISHQRSIDGKTPMMLAAENGKISMMQWLLRQGALLTQDTNGETVLHYAALMGHLETVEIVVEKMKAAFLSLDKENNEGNTPLTMAAVNGHKPIVIYLKEQGTKILHQSSITGITILMAAATHKKTAMAKWLLHQHLPLIDKKDKYGQTALHYAVGNGRLGTVKLLTEKMRAAKLSFDEEDHRGYTPIMLATLNGHIDVVIYLKDQGADIFHRNSIDGATSLIAAARNGKIAMTQWLLEQGACIEDKNKDGFTALQCAAADTSFTVSYLLSIDISIKKLKDNPNTILHYKVISQCKECLFKNYLDSFLNRDEENYTLLHTVAAFGTYYNLLDLLSHSRIHPLLFEKTHQGFTPLHLAAIRHDGNYYHVKNIQCLLENVLDINAQDNQGNTPLHKAIEYNRLRITRCLVEAGAVVNIANMVGQTPIDLLESKRFYSDESRALLQLLKDKLNLGLAFTQSRDVAISTGQEIQLIQNKDNISIESPSRISNPQDGMAALIGKQGFHKTKLNNNKQKKEKYIANNKINTLRFTEEDIKKFGGIVKEAGGEGDCLFRAISASLYGNAEQHFKLRELAVSTIKDNIDKIVDFMGDGCFYQPLRTKNGISNPDNINYYLKLMAAEGTWGGFIEIKALAHYLQRPIFLFSNALNGHAYNIFDYSLDEEKLLAEPLLLFYVGNNHYRYIEIQPGTTANDIIKSAISFLEDNNPIESEIVELGRKIISLPEELKKIIIDCVNPSDNETATEHVQRIKNKLNSQLDNESILNILNDIFIVDLNEPLLNSLKLDNNDLKKATLLHNQVKLKYEYEVFDKIIRVLSNKHISNNQLQGEKEETQNVSSPFTFGNQ